VCNATSSDCSVLRIGSHQRLAPSDKEWAEMTTRPELYGQLGFIAKDLAVSVGSTRRYSLREASEMLLEILKQLAEREHEEGCWWHSEGSGCLLLRKECLKKLGVSDG